MDLLLWGTGGPVVFGTVAGVPLLVVSWTKKGLESSSFGDFLRQQKMFGGGEFQF